MKANKIGILFVVAVLALAGIGASYAGFTDTITITGTANTGSVDLEVVACSGTWVWKQYDKEGTEAHDMLVHHDWNSESDLDGDGFENDDPQGFYDTSGYELVAYARAWETEDDKITIEFNNTFPMQDTEYVDYWGEPITHYFIDVLFHYKGKTPARINFDPVDQLDITYPADTPTDTNGDGWLHWLMDDDDPDTPVGFDAFMYHVNKDPDDTGTDIFDYDSGVYTIPQWPLTYDPSDAAANNDWWNGWVNPDGGQLHFCDFVKLDLVLDPPQDDVAYMYIPTESDGDGGGEVLPIMENFQDLSTESITWTIDLIQFDEYNLID